MRYIPFHAERVASTITAAADDTIIHATDRQMRRINKRLRRSGQQAWTDYTSDHATITVLS
jgi:hypothetical protein